MNEKVKSVFNYIIIMGLTIFIGATAISYFVKKSQVSSCDYAHINLCDTETLCKTANVEEIDKIIAIADEEIKNWEFFKVHCKLLRKEKEEK